MTGTDNLTKCFIRAPPMYNITNMSIIMHSVIDMLGSNMISRQITPPTNNTGKIPLNFVILSWCFAMYDAAKSDTCSITVIATGLEEASNNTVQSRLGAGTTYRQPTAHITPNSLKNLGVQPQAGQNAAGQQAARPMQGIQKPVDIRSSVEEKTLKIPDFLQRK